jgi:NADH-quinone oxidoreductase subunit L
VLVKPVVYLSRINKNDVFDLISFGFSSVLIYFNKLLVHTQSGKLRWYMAVITVGALITLTIAIFL